MLSGMNVTSSERVLGAIGEEKHFFTSDSQALSTVLQLSSRITSNDYRTQVLERARREAEFLTRSNIGVLYQTEAHFPARLKECEDAPVLLYTLGSLDLNANFVLGIVGTRHATPYGIGFVQQLIRDLCDSLPQKPIIVSGLAYGIDIAAHREALKCGCPTVAVLAHGLNMIYPAQHRREAAAIVESGGLLVTEYPSDSRVHKGSFRARNRIVAGLCDGILVAESASKGGALLTARLAQNYSREVMALPGRISDTYSQGCNKLIAENVASLITSSTEVAAILGWPVKAAEGTQLELTVEYSPDEQTVVDYLTERGEARINELAINCAMSVNRMMSLLIDMEFKHIVACYPGSRYRLV